MPPIDSRNHARALRLRRPEEFAAVLAAPRSQSLRAARHWLAMTAAWFPAASPAVRFGTTVGRRQVPRAVDRTLVKRIVREASRAAVPSMTAVCARCGVRADVAFRLKAARRGAAGAESMRAWRRTLRREADGLLAQFEQHLGALTS